MSKITVELVGFPSTARGRDFEVTSTLSFRARFPLLGLRHRENQVLEAASRALASFVD